MFINGINKKNTPQGKTFRYYQLTEAYQVGDAIKQRVTLYLGRHEILDDKKKRQAVGRGSQDLQGVRHIINICRTKKICSDPSK